VWLCRRRRVGGMGSESMLPTLRVDIAAGAPIWMVWILTDCVVFGLVYIYYIVFL